ncbi:hypothetical protein [uncultured Aquimarina sp.]|uniref:hypothetical protein n=1 Tax=uncultured Aquimarina sp. TaxID=575652 RepID=UPI0026186F82|nr:hypothetical protein [uncultured Aquimarina sp.]
MKNEYKILVIGIVALLILNFFGSIGSRMLDFNYSNLSPLSYTIYGLMGFLVTKQKNLKTGVLFAAILGFSESTVGSLVSNLFGEPNTGDLKVEMTTGIWVFMIIVVTGVAALIGLIGGLLTKILKKKSTDVQHNDIQS